MFHVLADSCTDDVASTARSYSKTLRRQEFERRAERDEAAQRQATEHQYDAASLIVRVARGLLGRGRARDARRRRDATGLGVAGRLASEEGTYRASIERAIRASLVQPPSNDRLKLVAPQLAMPEPPMVMTKNPVAYTRLCINGPNCPRAGISCTFAHSLAQLRPRPEHTMKPIRPAEIRWSVEPAPPPAPTSVIELKIEDNQPRSSLKKRHPSQIICRYGPSCRAQWCHFYHPWGKAATRRAPVEVAAPPENPAPICAPCVVADSGASECIVCLDAPRTHMALPCRHMLFCGACAGAWLQKQCPICRAPANVEVYHPPLWA
jgi:hypothetical protein